MQRSYSRSMWNVPQRGGGVSFKTETNPIPVLLPGGGTQYISGGGLYPAGRRSAPIPIPAPVYTAPAPTPAPTPAPVTGGGKLRPGDKLKLKLIRKQAREKNRLSEITNTRKISNDLAEQAIATLMQLANKASVPYTKVKNMSFDDIQNPEKTAYNILRALRVAI